MKGLPSHGPHLLYFLGVLLLRVLLRTQASVLTSRLPGIQLGRGIHLGLLAFLTLPLLGSGVVRTSSRNFLPIQIKEDWRDAHQKLRQRRYLEVSAICERLAAQVHELGHLAAESELLATAAGAQVETFQYRRALQTFLSARERAQQAGHERMTALISFNLSNVYFHLGAWREAQAAANRAGLLTHLSPNPEHVIPFHLHLARLASRIDDIRAAQPHLDAAFQLARSSANQRLLSLVHAAYAFEYFDAGDYPAAERAARAAISIRRQTHDPLLSSSLLTLSRIRLRQGDPREALTLAQDAIAQLAQHAPQRPLFRFFQYRGEALAALGRLPEARRDLLAAVEHLRPLRPDLLRAESIGMHAAATHQEVFSSLADIANQLYLASGNPTHLEEAFSAALENRALVMRSLLARHHDPGPAYAGLLSTLQHAELAALRDASPQSLEALSQARLKIAESQISSLSTSTGQLATPSLDLIRNTLPHDAAIILLQTGPARSYAWTLSHGRLRLSQLPPEAHLLALTTRHRQLLEQDSSLAAITGHELYNSLFSTLPPAVRQTRRWMILPDRFLFSIPYAALVREFVHGQPRYLVENVALQISPFLAPPQSTLDTPASPLLAAFGDPIYNTADPRLATPPALRLASARTSPDGNSIALPRLPGTAQEIRRAASAWHGSHQFFTGHQATLAHLRLALASQPQVLHLATHLVPSPADPTESLLLLSLTSSGQPELLDPATIAGLPAASSLIVMSGCSAGAASSIASEGLLGLSRAWLAAGASSVLATQWPMPDDSGELWHAFYSSWGNSALPPGAARAAQALQSAQRDAIASRSWRASPRYWASYFVLGSKFLYGHPSLSHHGRRHP